MWGCKLEMRVLKLDINSVHNFEENRLTVGGRSGCWERKGQETAEILYTREITDNISARKVTQVT